MSLQSRISIKIPSKTFLLGEYLALQGGPSLVVAHAPHFRFTYGPISEKNVEEHPSTPRVSPFFHAQSPAGLFLHNNRSELAQEEWQFVDPHYGSGGFGASTVQYIATWLMRELKKNKSLEISNEQALQCWTEYQNLFADDKKPSGADLLAQIKGGVSSWWAETRSLQTHLWPFENLKLDIFKTPYKVNTHLHLQDLEKRELPFADLKSVASLAIENFQQKNAEGFLHQSQIYSALLRELELTCKETLAILEELQKNSNVLHARGCGALGADVIAVYSQKGAVVEHPQLQRIATLPQDLSQGVEIEEKV